MDRDPPTPSCITTRPPNGSPSRALKAISGSVQPANGRAQHRRPEARQIADIEPRPLCAKWESCDARLNRSFGILVTFLGRLQKIDVRVYPDPPRGGRAKQIHLDQVHIEAANSSDGAAATGFYEAVIVSPHVSSPIRK